MSNNNTSNPDENPRDRFRRLLDEAEKAEIESTLPLGTEYSSEIHSKDVGEVEDSNLDLETDDSDQLTDQHSEFPLDQDIPTEDLDTSLDVSDTPTIAPFELDTPVPPMLGETPEIPSPALDTRGMPLPRRVDAIDIDATRVTRSAIESVPAKPTPTQSTTKRTPTKIPGRKRTKGKVGAQNWSGCLLRMLILGLFGITLIGIISGSIMLVMYYQTVKAEDWPDVGELYQRTSQFETTRILDRNGDLLYEILDPNAGRRSYVTLDDISPYVLAATIATEDKFFYIHPGFSVISIARAFWQNLSAGGTVVSGASTITQQLAKSLFLSSDERAQGTYSRKVKEALLAAELTRLYTKDEILELYLNEIYFGNLSYGIEAASQTYFGVSAAQLNLAQASFLAGLPQLPGIYDIYTNREPTIQRHQDVLLLMFQASQEQGCIQVSNNPQPICIEPGEAAAAAQEIENYDFNPPFTEIRYPHWVNYVRSLLESQYDPQIIYRSGFSVYTTLDPQLQDSAEEIVRDQLTSLSDLHVTNGALVTIKPSTGEILAMVGSADFNNELIDGQVNMAISPRQPGSSIKPLTYIAAFEKGWTPSTLIWDVYSEFPPSGDPNDPSPPYIPVNYDGTFHGPVTLRSALANSYNIPAVKALQFVGINDDPDTNESDGLLAFAKRLGITSLNRNDYGLSLTLGGGDVSLLELTGVYSIFANGGRSTSPVAIIRIEDFQGNLVYEFSPPTSGEQVVRAEHAYLISSILSDNHARTPAFGSDSILKLPFDAAVKTGTTNDFRDNWTIGYTPDLVVGTWVGNADYTPMQGTTGLTGAAPIWSSYMTKAIQKVTGNNPSPFIKPTGIIEKVVCTISGTEPSQWCPSHRYEIFVSDQLPRIKGFDLWQKASIDSWTELLSSAECSEYIQQEMGLNVKDKWAIKWINETSQGKSWAKSIGFNEPIFFTPNRTCTQDDSRPILSFESLADGQVVETSPLTIYGRAGATSNFYQYRLEFGFGDNPSEWFLLDKSKIPVNEPDALYEWDIKEIPRGRVTLRLFLISTEGTTAQVRIRLELQLPTPTPTETPTATNTQTSTSTPSSTWTETATMDLTSTFTPSPESSATDTLLPTETSIASLTPSP